MTPRTRKKLLELLLWTAVAVATALILITQLEFDDPSIQGLERAAAVAGSKLP